MSVSMLVCFVTCLLLVGYTVILLCVVYKLLNDFELSGEMQTELNY